MRIGSLFSGVGGLDLAALDLFPGASMAWHSEINPAASKALAYHWPDVPNLGDVSLIDWATVETVDVLAAGFPCQDVSLAGRRAGLQAGTRSGLWSYVAAAIDVLRPRYVLLENVRGLLSAGAVRGVESGSGDLADLGGRPVLRALGAVLGDLADLGFDAEWTCIRASDVGACHQRARVFILAHPADATGGRRAGVHDGTGSAAACRGGERVAGRSVGGPSAVALLPTPQVADVTGGHKHRSGTRSAELLLPGVAEAYATGSLLPTPRVSDANGAGAHGDGGLDLRTAVTMWGDYAPAIQRQEALSRPAPEPTELGAKGNPRLAAAFAEWLMFWPAGWVTSPDIGLSRTEQLHVIGNGVVPPQALNAFRFLRASVEVPQPYPMIELMQEVP